MTTIQYKTTCPRCRKVTIIELDADAYTEWKTNPFCCVQDVFPNLSADEREQLISGICPECWNKMFS